MTDVAKQTVEDGRTAQKKRLPQAWIRNMRTRSSQVPTDLARTSAFAPYRNLSKSTVKRAFVVDNSVVEVEGQELGVQHRDALYALFRLDKQSVRVKAEVDSPNLPLMPDIVVTRTTWRMLLHAMNMHEHKTNLKTVLKTFEQLRATNIRVFEGGLDEYRRAEAAGDLAAGVGRSQSILRDITWEGNKLDNVVVIEYGHVLRNLKALTQIRPVYFELKTDYAKSILPFLDSHPETNQVSETDIALLLNRDLSTGSYSQVSKFRDRARAAFEDMQRCGALKDVQIEETWVDRRKYIQIRFTRIDLPTPKLPSPEPEVGVICRRKRGQRPDQAELPL
jgi:hypothetical protein